MANWFKIYETNLDESRLKYALNKLPEVGWVWIGILSECCKHRSDTIRWSDKLHEVFGLSDRLKVSIPKINEAVNVLMEIEYITVTGDRLKVLKWKEKQSEYNHRKERGDYQINGDYPIVSDKSVKSPLEERRGEENKREEKEKKVASLPVVDHLPEEWMKLVDFKAAWNNWLEHLKQKRKTPSLHSRDLQLARLAKLGPARAIETINNSIEHNWQGLYEKHSTANKPNPRNFGIVGQTAYTKKPRLQRELEEKAAMAGKVDEHKTSPSPT